MKHQFLKFFPLIAFLLSSALSCTLTYAEADRADYDIDDDGLIEINDLHDLDEIRNNLDGSTLYGESTGCPESGCHGFELTQELNFDTNGDGEITASDAFWNAGQGWLPLGSESSPFIATLDGAGFSVLNLYIDRPELSYVGLIARARDASILNLNLAGTASSVTGASDIGAVLGRGREVIFSGIHVRTSVSSTTRHTSARVGGIVGSMSGGQLRESTFAGSVYAATDDDCARIGGLVGYAYGGSISSSVSAGMVETENAGCVGGYCWPGCR